MVNDLDFIVKQKQYWKNRTNKKGILTTTIQVENIENLELAI